MIKDLLLIVDRGSEDDATVDAALRLAEAHRAHLVVAVVSAIPLPDYAISTFPPFIALDEYREKTDAKERALRQRASQTTVPAEIHILSDLAYVLLEKAPAQTRYADLIIVGPKASWEDHWLRRRMTENVLLGSGRPVLLLPDRTIPSFKRAMIGWNAGPEATRAVQVALPLLDHRADLVVAVVNPEIGDGRHGSDPGADIAHHLARHDFRVDVASITSAAGAEADALRTLATSRDTDLLVVGAFGHSRLREVILGGVTAALIDASPVPTLLMH